MKSCLDARSVSSDELSHRGGTVRAEPRVDAPQRARGAIEVAHPRRGLSLRVRGNDDQLGFGGIDEDVGEGQAIDACVGSYVYGAQEVVDLDEPRRRAFFAPGGHDLEPLHAIGHFGLGDLEGKWRCQRRGGEQLPCALVVGERQQVPVDGRIMRRHR
jgi:hypothetical protein